MPFSGKQLNACTTDPGPPRIQKASPGRRVSSLSPPAVPAALLLGLAASPLSPRGGSGQVSRWRWLPGRAGPADPSLGLRCSATAAEGAAALLRAPGRRGGSPRAGAPPPRVLLPAPAQRPPSPSPRRLPLLSAPLLSSRPAGLPYGLPAAAWPAGGGEEGQGGAAASGRSVGACFPRRCPPGRPPSARASSSSAPGIRPSRQVYG